MTDLFTPTATWQRLPERCATARRVSAAVSNLIATAVVALPLGFFFDWRWAAGLASGGRAAWIDGVRSHSIDGAGGRAPVRIA